MNRKNEKDKIVEGGASTVGETKKEKAIRNLEKAIDTYINAIDKAVKAGVSKAELDEILWEADRLENIALKGE